LVWEFSLVIYPGSTPVGNATLVVANVLTCSKHSQKVLGERGAPTPALHARLDALSNTQTHSCGSSNSSNSSNSSKSRNKSNSSTASASPQQRPRLLLCLLLLCLVLLCLLLHLVTAVTSRSKSLQQLLPAVAAVYAALAA
jgi:hypothetical protein